MSVLNALPNKRELEKEIGEYLTKKYGCHIKVVSPVVFTNPDKNQIPAGAKSSIDNIVNFNLKPEELVQYLDRFIIRQDKAKAILATKICTHFHRIKREIELGLQDDVKSVGRIKNNILLLGPTGVGKTYLIKLIAHKLGVPFVKGDATKFSETGYVGGDIEDLVRDLVKEADDNIELARYGIIYLDEIDKIASRHNIFGADVSRTGVQRALLKPMEETEVELRVPHDPISQLEAIEHFRRTGKKEKKTVNTRNILFVMSGAFSELPEIVKKRLAKQEIGFGAAVDSKDDVADYLSYVMPEDLIEYGFESEFIGRLPVFSILNRLSKQDLFQILKNPNNPIITGKKQDFKAYDIQIQFEEESFGIISHIANKHGTGARALVSVVENALIPFEKALPSTNIKELLITPEMIEDSDRILKELMENPQEKKRHERFEELILLERDKIIEDIEKNSSDYKKSSHILTRSRMKMIVDEHIKNDQPLELLMKNVLDMIETINKFEEYFSGQFDFDIHFDNDVIDDILNESIKNKKDVDDVCNQIMKNFDYGLNLLMDKTGKHEFFLTKDAIKNPEVYIESMIKEMYK